MLKNYKLVRVDRDFLPYTEHHSSPIGIIKLSTLTNYKKGNKIPLKFVQSNESKR